MTPLARVALGGVALLGGLLSWTATPTMGPAQAENVAGWATIAEQFVPAAGLWNTESTYAAPCTDAPLPPGELCTMADVSQWTTEQRVAKLQELERNLLELQRLQQEAQAPPACFPHRTPSGMWMDACPGQTAVPSNPYGPSRVAYCDSPSGAVTDLAPRLIPLGTTQLIHNRL